MANKQMETAVAIPSMHLGGKSRARGEQVIVLRSYKDGLGRMLSRCVFGDGEELVLFESDLQEIAEAPAKTEITVSMTTPWGLNMEMEDHGGES